MCSKIRAYPRTSWCTRGSGLQAYIEREKAQKRPLKNETMVTIACGANMNFDRLRFVAERAEVGEAHGKPCLP